MQIGWIVLVAAKFAAGQDCLFYNPNSTEILTSTFLSVPEDVEVGKVIARFEARIALRIALKAVEDEISERLFAVLIRGNTSVEVLVTRKLSSLLPQTKALNFQLQCTGPSGAYSALPFLITIQDVNDHAPSFADYSYEVQVSEFHSVGSSVIEGLSAVAHDLPNTPNTEVQYSITSGNELHCFRLQNPLEGKLSLDCKLDYESGPRQFQLNITATDSGVPPLSNWTTVIVRVIDEDDQNPVFEEDLYEATIIEEIQEYEPVLSVRAWDGDVGINETLRYDITDGLRAFMKHFTIDSASGMISLLKAIDRELLPSALSGYVTLIVQATQDNDPNRYTKAAVRIFVEDINDNGPRFLEQYIRREINLLPSVFSNLPIDLAQLTVFDRDTYENAAFVAFIESNITSANSFSPLLVLEPDEGANQTITLRAENITALLTEAGNQFTLTVIALDSIRNKRTTRAALTAESMQDVAVVDIRFNLPFPGMLSVSDAKELPADARSFMAQYPVILLAILGSMVCVLLIVIVGMAAAYHSMKKMVRVRPTAMSDATSTTSSITVSPISLYGSNESQA